MAGPIVPTIVIDGIEGLTYTNSTPSVIPVGGIDAGTTFDNVSFAEFVSMLLYPELFGTLTGPSSTFTSSVTGFREIGEVIPTITFNSTFNRGSINPQYQSDSPFRSGLPNSYQYIGLNSPGTVNSTSLSDSFVINNHTVTIGIEAWQGRVNYDAGIQPKGSEGTDFDSPLPAGSTSYTTRSITGVYPVFATTNDIEVLDKQPLASMTSTFFQTDMQAETPTSGKQTVDFPDAWATIIGIQFFNTNNSQWEWINGTPTNSLATFDTSATTHVIQGNTINYTRYTHNGTQIGDRLLRWYTA